MAINLSKNDVKSTDVHPNVKVLIENSQLFPPAEEINIKSGLGMWTIKGYRIWAQDYLKACEHLELIENF